MPHLYTSIGLCFLSILQYNAVITVELSNDYELIRTIQGKAETTQKTIYKVYGLVQCSNLCNREVCWSFSIRESDLIYDCVLSTDSSQLPLGYWNVYQGSCKDGK